MRMKAFDKQISRMLESTAIYFVMQAVINQDEVNIFQEILFESFYHVLPCTFRN